MTEKQCYTVKTLAERWAVSDSQIYSLIQNKTLKHLRIGFAIANNLDIMPFGFITAAKRASCYLMAG